MRTFLLGTAAVLSIAAGAQAQTIVTDGDETVPDGDGTVIVEGAEGDQSEAAPDAEPLPVVPVPESQWPPEGEPLYEEDVPEAEPLREVDITDPDAPPIEDAENVIPERDGGDEAQVPLIKSETGLSSPTHTAPVTPDPERAAIERPPSAPETFAVADMRTMDAEELLRVGVYDITDERIGTIDRWLDDAPNRFPQGAVIGVGGLLGLGERQVVIETDQLVLMTEKGTNDMRVYVDLTEDQIDALPEVEG